MVVLPAAASFAAIEPAGLPAAPPPDKAPGATNGNECIEPDDGAAVAALEKARVRLVRGYRGTVLNVEISGPSRGAAEAADPIAHLGGLRGLESLKIEHRPVSEAGLACIGGLTRLKRLYFNDVAITDEGLRHLAKLADLEVLSLEKSAITESGLAHLAGLAIRTVAQPTRTPP
ncbi:MAG TPA: hypothetical protein DCM87_06765 [Planctomycetes bacterium]|nr:hypothetical protein [Planctomycetota bacterium]